MFAIVSKNFTHNMVSVCIASYNGEKFILEQLNSILSQIHEKDEILICDDKSSDNTVDIIKKINDSRIRLYKNDKNLGYTKNFEKVLSLSKGDIIITSDQDDVWLPDKYKTIIKNLKLVDFVMHDAKIVDTATNELFTSYFKKRKIKKSKLGNIIKFSYLGCCMAFNKNVLEFALPFPRNSNYCTFDNWIFLCAIFYFRIKIINKPLLLYRRHDDNASTGGFNSDKTLLFKLQYRLYLIFHLILRKFKLLQF